MKRLTLILFLFTNLAFAEKKVISQDELALIEKLDKLQKEGKKIEDVVKEEQEKVIKQEAKKEETKASKPEKKTKNIYEPAPVVDNTIKTKGYFLERDTSKTVTVRMSDLDELNIYMCFTSAVNIALDESYKGEEFQKILLDDQGTSFEGKEFSNNRGFYVRLKAPIREGEHVQTKLRMVKKSNDKALKFNLIGVPCPAKGLNPYPDTFYVKRKYESIDPNDAENEMMPPLDKIIYESMSFKKVNKKAIKIDDVLTVGNSKYMVFSVDIQFPNNPKEDQFVLEDYEFKSLDNFQISKLDLVQKFRASTSDTVSKINGVTTLRYNLYINIDKKYILDSRYIYLMFLDKKTKEYQLIFVDLVPWFQSIRNRGLNI